MYEEQSIQYFEPFFEFRVTHVFLSCHEKEELIKDSFEFFMSLNNM